MRPNPLQFVTISSPETASLNRADCRSGSHFAKCPAIG
jgi:hypothetical protein